MKLSIGFGKKPQDLELPDHMVMGILETNKVELGLTGIDEVIRALHNPIGTPELKNIITPGEKIVIITSDITRPVPSYKVIPPIIEELNNIGVQNDDITIVFALGSHRPHTEEEMISLVGEELFNKIKCIDSDVNDFVHLGTTDAGTPIDIFTPVAEADRVICVANIEYHYFAGYSGGAKSVMPGVSTSNAIQTNHSKMVLPDARAGKVEGNPVRDDLEEAIGSRPIDFIVNVVLDEKKEIVYAVAGDFIKAHRVGCEFLDSIYKKELREKADIVVVSQGGAPKDINLYQTQKALDNAKHAVKDGGIIVLVGSCIEGFGSKIFESWMTEATEPEDLVTRIKENFVLGGHKAAAVALVLEKARIFLVSEMDDEVVRSIFMEPYKTVQEAFDHAVEILGDDAKVLIMPYGGSTLPVVI